MAESRRSVPTRFTAEQPRKLVFSTLDRDLSSEDDLTSDEEIVEEITEVTSDDTKDSVVSENEEYQVGNATTSENETEENEGTRSYVGRRGRLGGRRIIGGRGWRSCG